jgi:predicted metal-dependent hydrolase
MSETWSCTYNGISYPVVVTFKRVRNINFHMARDGKSMTVSAPYYIHRTYLLKKINEYFPKLQKKTVFPSPIEGNDVFVFGEKTNIVGLKNLDEKTTGLFLKTQLLAYLTARVPYFEGLMGISKPYKVKVRIMRSRYGVNNYRTHAITFALELVHYAPVIIDSVIVHELSHEFERNHGERFYAYVYRYCPDYKKLYTSLRKHRYGNA